MKKSLVALALFGAFAGVAHAQSSVVIYGTVDAGISKKSGNGTNAVAAVAETATALGKPAIGATNGTTIGKRNNNKLGFMGTEDLGNGLSALFQLEMRFEPDTGTIENVNRPLFQGQSRVGLRGAFGTARIGRGLTAFQESSTAFEPWSGIPSFAGFQTDLAVAGYNSDPLGITDTSKNRFSNAVFYNSPVMSGFQVNATVGTKENAGSTTPIVGRGTVAAPQFVAGASASTIPYSLSATYNNGPIGAMAAYERNAVKTNLWSVAGSFKPMEALKLMASYQRQDEDKTKLTNPKTKAWILGANYTMGPGKFLAGYGQKSPDGVTKTKQASLGYEYSLSKRTYVYADVSNKKAATKVNFYGVGVSHNF